MATYTSLPHYLLTKRFARSRSSSRKPSSTAVHSTWLIVKSSVASGKVLNAAARRLESKVSKRSLSSASFWR